MLDIDAGISQEKGQSPNNRNASMTVGPDGIILGVQKNGSVKGEQASEGGPRQSRPGDSPCDSNNSSPVLPTRQL